MARIAFVNPRFEVSYWGLEHAVPLLGKRANLPTHCLPLLAALTPEEHEVTLIDENVEEIDFDLLAGFDLVGITGMSVQRFRMREIMEQLKQRGVFVVVGGPWVSVYEDYFDGLVDAIFVGEADQSWPQFLREWTTGRHQTRYEQSEATDMAQVPTPRFDLMKMQHYMFGSLQFSRGCPFQCEFCDIIVIFGRRPRLKTSDQVIAELEALRAQNMEFAFVVDDNLIGNKKAVKLLLRDVVKWQQAKGYPLTFFTEASLDLADDPELMDLMVQANFVSVFVGIESPNEASLLETKKFQNVRQGGTMMEKILTIQDAGLEVWCGMILGFDNDDCSIFDAQREFLQDAQIAHVMIGMLHAIPKTPLYERLEAEGRLDTGDPPEFGTNVIPARMTRGELYDGYVAILKELYEPDNYFARLDSLYLKDFRFGTARAKYWRRHPLTWLTTQLRNFAGFALISHRLTRTVPEKELRAEYRRRISYFLCRRRDPAVLLAYAVKCAMHYHHYRMSQEMACEELPVVHHM